jgi:hypothetical protein
MSLRLTNEIVESLDKEVAKLIAANPGLVVTRTDAIRMAIVSWLKDRGHAHVK